MLEKRQGRKRKSRRTPLWEQGVSTTFPYVSQTTKSRRQRL